jgi:hypothetical protein
MKVRTLLPARKINDVRLSMPEVCGEEVIIGVPRA